MINVDGIALGGHSPDSGSSTLPVGSKMLG